MFRPGLCKLSIGTEDPVGYKSFPWPSPFLLCRNHASFSLLDFPWVPRGRFKQLLIREGRVSEKREEQSRNNNAVLGQGPGSPSRNIHHNTLSSSTGTKAPTQWRMATSGRAQDSWSPALCSPPTNQKKVCTQWEMRKTLTPSPNDSPFNNFMVEENLQIFFLFWTWPHLLPRLPASWIQQPFLSNQQWSLQYWLLSSEFSNKYTYLTYNPSSQKLTQLCFDL